MWFVSDETDARKLALAAEEYFEDEMWANSQGDLLSVREVTDVRCASALIPWGQDEDDDRTCADILGGKS